MRFLLDTHTFLWSISAPEKLPLASRDLIADASNETFVSSVSFWEIAIKSRLGKLNLNWEDDVVAAAVNAGFVPISLDPEEAATSDQLQESTHYDPFDRMLIWQAISRKLTLVSGDTEFTRFKKDGLQLLWK